MGVMDIKFHSLLNNDKLTWGHKQLGKKVKRKAERLINK